MSIQFNADEIFEIAERIEANGAAFYRAAARKIPEASRGFLLDLAVWEEQHQQKFAAMRTRLAGESTEPTVWDPDCEAAQYLQALADGAVFPADEAPVTALPADSSVEDILRVALEREKASIAFYVGMQYLVPPALGKAEIDGIVLEEMSHVTLLTRKLVALKR
ncbi:MAG: ferritin family protein [Kiritimatiellaeota bacterium]|nr:ferritin family protein [Kiritimatiellota bacterium]